MRQIATGAGILGAKETSRRAAFVYPALCVAILGWAAFQRFHLPIWPLADKDTWGYLNPALAKLTGGAFEHTGGRNFVYPGFLFLVLATFKSFGAITIVQHTLGLLTGILLLGCWHQIRRFLRVGTTGRHTHEIAGVVLLAIYLLSSQPIIAEHELRPEAITPFCAMSALLLALKFIEQRYFREERRRSAWLGAAVIFLSFLLLSLKPSFGLTALFTMFPVFVSLFYRKATRAERLIPVAAAAISVLLLILPEHFLAKSDPFARRFLPEMVFYVHANLVTNQMDEDIARGECGERGCEWLNRLRSELRQEMRRSWNLNQSYGSLGFDLDYLMYRSNVIRQWREKFFEGESATQYRFYWYYVRRTLLRHPDWFLAKVWRQLLLFYSPNNQTFQTSREISLKEPYRLTVEVLQAPRFRPTFLRFPPSEKYEASCASLATRDLILSDPPRIRACNLLLQRVYVPVFLAVLIASGLLLCSRKLRLAVGLIWPATLFVFSYNFGTCLETAIIHSLHNPRYLTVQFSFTILAEFVGIYFLTNLKRPSFQRQPERAAVKSLDSKSSFGLNSRQGSNPSVPPCRRHRFISFLAPSSL